MSLSSLSSGGTQTQCPHRYADSPLDLKSYTSTPKHLLMSAENLKQLTPGAKLVVDDILAQLQDRLALDVKYFDLDQVLEIAGWGPEGPCDIWPEFRETSAWFVELIALTIETDISQVDLDQEWHPLHKGLRLPA